MLRKKSYRKPFEFKNVMRKFRYLSKKQYNNGMFFSNAIAFEVDAEFVKG